MATMLKNKYVYQSDKLNFSRSIFRYEKRHSTNILSGRIVPVHHQFLYPGDSPDLNFGCVIESAPLISTCLDNIYVDIVSVWTPARLVMEDWNEWLGESHSVAFTINRDVKIPKTGVDTMHVYHYGSEVSINRAYLADNYLAPHLGFRLFGSLDISAHTITDESGNVWSIPTDSEFYNGVSVLPSRVYYLNWNTFFRNENIQAPYLINKTSTLTGTDLNFAKGLGELKFANKLKTWYTDLTPAPSLLDMTLSLGEVAPVGFITSAAVSGSQYNTSAGIPSGFSGSADTFNQLEMISGTAVSGISGQDVFADLSSLTVNRMYYALMEQRFANKMMKGRRAVEFYANFFGVQDSDAGHDLPKLLVQKRYPLNISQVIATASGTNGSETTDLGQRGAFSTTGFGDSLIKNFTATEHGFIQTYMIIRGQPSLSEGIDKYLSYESLLDTYIPEFDHIGPVGVETLEVIGPRSNTFVGYTNAWYAERNAVSDVVGIMAPGQPLAYKTLAINFEDLTSATIAVSDWYVTHWPSIIDKIFMFPVCYVPGGSLGPDQTLNDSNGEAFLTTRYQFLTQFVVRGKVAKVMSPDSEPLKLRM